MPEKKEPPFLILFLLLSLLLHLSLAYYYRDWQPSAKALEELLRKKKDDIPVQIIELPPKKKKSETPKPPPKKPSFLSDRNRQSKAETRTERISPKAVKAAPKPSQPKPKPVPKKPALTKPEVKPRSQSKALEKVSPPVKKEIVKELVKEAAKKPLPDIKKLFPSFEELTKITEEYRSRPTSSGEHRPRLPNKLKRGTEISLNTLDYKFHSYYLALKRKIELVWEYPYKARQTGVQGRLLMRFIINQDGSLAEVTILRSSGVALLDHEAVRAIRNASPFPPLPKRMNTERLSITATFEYLLSYRSVH
ncbi:MAG: energy transducer TonB [Deltaproteobacteria bacterium]|nr:energy transducer TonB [Deltaproteobacteria bacterium]